MIYDGTNRAMEKLTETTFKPYQAIVSGAVALQEQNMKFAWGLIGQSRKQQEALQALVNESFRVYTDLLHATVPSSRNGSLADDRGPELPIKDYDRLTVKEVIGRLDELDAYEVEKLKEYEKNNKNRVTLIERFDRSLV